jgi:hypothetical protein
MHLKSPLLAILCLLAFGHVTMLLAANSASPADNAKQSESALSSAPKLTLARNGSAVLVSWSLPPGGYRAIEITRNNQADPRGRISVGTVGPSDANLLDTVPDKTGSYWYWLKVTRSDLTVFNVGPVMSEAAGTGSGETAKPDDSSAPIEPTLTVARNGVDVMLAWALPKGSYRSIEITRHTQSNPRGRTSVGVDGPSQTNYLDSLPDKAPTYWYWLKVTRSDLTVFNVGPARSDPSEVWTP